MTEISLFRAVFKKMNFVLGGTYEGPVVLELNVHIHRALVYDA
jgi:hypothetical protein